MKSEKIPVGLFHGLNTIDIQFLLDHYPAVNSKTKARKNGIYVGGPATNASVAFSWLKGKSLLISPVGMHHFTSFISGELYSKDIILLDPIASIKTEPTFASIVSNADSGDRTVFSYHPSSHEYQYNALPYDSLNDIDIVLLDGFYMKRAIEIARMANEQNIPVVLDGGSWKEGMEELLPLINIAICSSDFFPSGTAKVEEVFDFLMNKGINKIAVTRGKNPIYFSRNGGMEEIEIQKINAMDTLGAGDFFHGAFCYFYAKNGHFQEALQKASKIATLSCTAFGTREWLNTSPVGPEFK